jgi:dihydroneopterin aldolase
VIVELRGLELRGFHGAEADERERGQVFLYDVALEVGDRGASDRLADAVDYTEVAAAVREVNERRFDLLEALGSAVADTLLERFRPEWVRVRVRKPEVRPAGLDVEFSAVTVTRP